MDPILEDVSPLVPSIAFDIEPVGESFNAAFFSS